jgi:hypothetical protein
MLVTATLVGLGGLGLLAGADFLELPRFGPGSLKRLAWIWQRGDRLHFAVHVLAGRLYGLCPCTQGRAAEQYRRARVHAVTALQVQLLADSHPRKNGTWLGFLVDPLRVIGEWTADGVSWLRGAHSTNRVEMGLTHNGFAPPLVRVARGTTLVLRNMDTVVHVVSSPSGQFQPMLLQPEGAFAWCLHGRRVYQLQSGRLGSRGRQRGTVEVG